MRPVLGVEIDEDFNRRFLAQLGVEGVLVLRIEPGSAAAVAGLHGTSIDRRGNITPGDVIQKIGGRKITSVPELLARLDDFQLGDKTTLTFWRNGQVSTIDIHF